MGEIAVFRAIRRCSGISRVELANITGLTSAAVSQIVRRIIDAELVQETEARHRTVGGGGRSRVGLCVGAMKMRVLGVTVRRFDVLWGLVTLAGDLEDTWQTPLDDGRPALEDLGHTMDTIAPLVEAKKLRIMTVGVGLPTFQLAWEPREAVAQVIAERILATPIYLGHNGSYAALAEDWFNGANLAKHWLYVFLGVGIGGAVVRRGEGAEDPRISSVETGHVGIDSEGPPCFCGNRGCVELTAAPLSLAHGTKLSARGGLESLRRITAEDKETAARTLSYGLMSIVNVLDLETIVIGGLDQSLIEEVYGSTRQLLREHTTPNRRPLQVGISTLGEWSSVSGAAMGAMDGIGQDVSSWRPAAIR